MKAESVEPEGKVDCLYKGGPSNSTANVPNNVCAGAKLQHNGENLSNRSVDS